MLVVSMKNVQRYFQWFVVSNQYDAAIVDLGVAQQYAIWWKLYTIRWLING